MGLEYRRLRAPAEDGQSLTVPDIAGSRQMLLANEQILAGHSFAINSIPISGLRQTARREFLELAARYTRRYIDIGDIRTETPERIFVTGHQPVLFHPGVWFKNFRLDHLARLCHGIAVNVQIDNDLCAGKSIRVPSGSTSRPRFEWIPFDRSGALFPYEGEEIGDEACFRSFAERVATSIEPLVPHPLIREYWEHVLACAREFDNPFSAIAAGRHRLEHSIGLKTLEVPLGQLCETASFRHFVSALLNDHSRFRELFNRSLGEFRRIHRIRSRSHPVPDLEVRSAAEGPPWTEAPFWIWSDSDPRRRRLMVRSNGNSLQLADGGSLSVRIPLAMLENGLQELAEKGFRIRPRAVTTTMYLRLVLADFFIHGIGGAKYDQLTDQIIELFFGPPPSSAVVTSTHLLPTGVATLSQPEMQLMKQRLRDMEFNPDRYLDPNEADLSPYVEEKRVLLDSIPVRGNRKSWRDSLRKINARLQPAVEQKKMRLKDEIDRGLSALETGRLLGSREYAWPLFPASLIGQLQDLAAT